jgi:hypothetical protein
MNTRCQETQINRPMRTLSSLITKLNVVTVHIYALTIFIRYLIYTESSVNEGSTTPP